MSDEEAPAAKKPLEIYNRFTFNTLIEELLEKSAVKHARLLRKKRDWQMDDQAKEEIRMAANELCNKWFYHASLFAMYRTETTSKEQLKKRKVQVTEDDLDLAWQSLT